MDRYVRAGWNGEAPDETWDADQRAHYAWGQKLNRVFCKHYGRHVPWPDGTGALEFRLLLSLEDFNTEELAEAWMSMIEITH